MIDALFALLIVAAAIFVIRPKASSGAAAKRDGATPGQLAQGGRAIMTPIPKGYQIYQDRLLVAGLSFRKDDAARFIASSNQTLELERDAGNPHDENAIKIIGKCDCGTYLLGYIEAPLARYVVERGLADVVKLRLMRSYVGRDQYLEVMYQIIGPKSEKHRYDA